MATYVTPGELGLSTPLGELLGSSTAEMNAELADYANLGVKWIRTNIWWDVAQPSSNGSYNWAPMDKAIDAANSYGIKIIAELVGKPSWVDGTFSSTSSQQAFGNFVRAAAEHFGDKVDFWEVWNEPNMEHITPANYVKILREAYGSIKAVDSGDMVISGGTAATPQTGNGLWGAVDYLQQMYANGAKGYFDAVGFHPYTYPLMPDNSAPWNGWQIMEDGIRSTMVANGDGGLQVWMTELSAPTNGDYNVITQGQQATILQQAHDIAAGYSWAGPIMWYSYKDRGGVTNSNENWFGLVGPDGSHKAAYDTYKAIAGGSSGQGSGSGGASGTGSATFTTQNYTGDDNANVIVGNSQNNTIWAQGGDDTISGGKGNDQIYGGSSNDTFVFTDRANMGRDIIRDFQSGDQIDLSGIDANTRVAGDQAFSFVGKNWLSRAEDLGYYKDQAGHISIRAM